MTAARQREVKAHLRLEKLVAAAMRAKDPVSALRSASRDRALTPALRKLLAQAHSGGVRLSALLVAKLRFEKLLRGSDRAARWFDEDPRGFSEAFRRYHSEVPPTGLFASTEGTSFDAWLSSQR